MNPIMPSPNAAQSARAEFFSVEHGDRAAAHGGGVDADGMSEDGSESTTWSVSADPTSQAAQALLDIQSHGSGPRRPARRSLDPMKVVATPDAAALPGVSEEMEALLSLMDATDRKQYLAWMAMHAASMREGLLDRAARAEQRMEALENRVFGVITTPTAAASSSGSSSSGDGASVAAAFAASADAQAAAAAQRVRERNVLDALQLALDKQVTECAVVKKHAASFTLLTKSARVIDALVSVLTATAGVPPKGLFYADLVSQCAPLDLPSLQASAATRVSETAAEVEQSLSFVTPACDVSDSVPMNPYMRYLHLLRRKAAVVIKDCPYLSLIDGKVRLAILSMLASEWQTSTSVHLCETATSVITVVYAALGHSDVELYNHEIRRLMSPPKYLTPVGGFPVHALLLQFQALYRKRMHKLRNLQLPPELHQLALMASSLPQGSEGSALQTELNALSAEMCAFIHSPPGTTEKHVEAFIAAMLAKYANKPYSGAFVLPSPSVGDASAYYGSGSSPWGSKKSPPSAPGKGHGKASGQQPPVKEAPAVVPPVPEKAGKAASRSGSSGKSAAKNEPPPAEAVVSPGSDTECETGSGASDAEQSVDVEVPPRTRSGSPKPSQRCPYQLKCRAARNGTCPYYHHPQQLLYIRGRIERCDAGAACKLFITEAGCAKYHTRAEVAVMAPNRQIPGNRVDDPKVVKYFKQLGLFAYHTSAPLLDDTYRVS